MTKRLTELDGLRGIAVLMVLLEHYVAGSQLGTRGTLIHMFGRLCRLGWTGVDLFFVLSGFLIGGILLDARNSPTYFKTFYGCRAYRILRVYYV
jgi:peptidoglycan/LPS O-acetylase OafA/YrhL